MEVAVPSEPSPDRSAAGIAPASTVQFAHLARLLAGEVRRRGLVAPGFRCPPRMVGVDRTIRRRPGGAASVAVRVRGRPWTAVVADMIEGAVVANRLVPPASDRLRGELWESVRGEGASGEGARGEVPISRVA